MNKMGSLPRHAPAKPHIRLRKLSPMGRSAFPPTSPTAFPPAAPDPGGPQPAFAAPMTGTTSPGDAGG